MAYDNETKKYEEPTDPEGKLAWKQNLIKKYTQPGISDDQFSGGTTRSPLRLADKPDTREDNPPPEVGMVPLPSYMDKVKKLISGIREEALDEAFPPKKDGDKKPDDKKKDKKKSLLKKSADGEEDQDQESDQEDDEGQEGQAPNSGQQDKLEKKSAAQGVDSGINGSEVKTQLETIALQAAELFAEVDEKQAFDAEIKDSLAAAAEALGKVNAAIMNDDGEQQPSEKDQDAQNKPDYQDNNQDDTKKLNNMKESWVKSYLSEVKDLDPVKAVKEALEKAGIDHKDLQIAAVEYPHDDVDHALYGKTRSVRIAAPTESGLHDQTATIREALKSAGYSHYHHRTAVNVPQDGAKMTHIDLGLHTKGNMNEETISELSRELLKRYVDHAEADRRHRVKNFGSEHGIWMRGDARTMRKQRARDNGIPAAKERLAKE